MSFATKIYDKYATHVEVDLEVALLPSLGDVNFPFKGKIHTPGMEEYMQSIEKNFAYQTKYKDEMYPTLFAYPDNGELSSIESAISFGKKAGLHVMGRSGGHQYSGVSSDNGSVIIDMEEWNTIGDLKDSESLVGVGPELAQKYPKMVTVGVGVCLGDLANRLGDFNCTVPMGECPSVCVGGHMQSGGWGRMNRPLGLFTEYVYGFTIVTTEGVKRVSCKSTGRELDLYNAVRGGSPGAFGIVTDATLLVLSDSNFPNSRSYGQILPYFFDDGDDDDDDDDDDDGEGPLAEIMEMYTNLINKLGDSEEAMSLGLEVSYLAKKTQTPSIISGLPGMPQAIQLILVEATVVDDTDESSMNVFREIMETTEQAKRRRNRNCCCSRLTLVDMAMKHLSPSTFKDGRKRMPFSVINKTSVKGPPFVMERTKTNPIRRPSKFPICPASLYPKSEAQIPIDLFMNGNDEAVTNGGRMGIMGIFKQHAKRSLDKTAPIDLLVIQNMLFGTKRKIGPFPSSVQWGQKTRGCFGFDTFGSQESLSDPRTYQMLSAFYDLEHEFMINGPGESTTCMISFTADTPEGDTSIGGGYTKPKFSGLDLNDPRVQARYYDPDSEKGFDWVASIKFDWDIEDVFHSRFTVPPRPLVPPLARASHFKQDDNLGLSNNSVDVNISVPTAKPIF